MKKPHSSQNTISVLPLLLSVLLIALCAVSFLKAGEQNTTVIALKEFPWHSQAHVSLAALLMSNGNELQAQQELVLAHSKPTWPIQKQVLGETDELSDLEKKVREEQQNFAEKERYWKDITEKYPLYKDGWIQRAYLASLQKKTTEAMEYTQKVQQLDPNFGIYTEIEEK